MRTLVGSLVTLRPITEADLPSVARASMPWAQQGESEADVLGRLRDRFRGQAAFAAFDYVIEIDGHGIGNIQARQDAYLLGLFEIGIVVFEDADKSKGVGREALALMTAQLFDHQDAYRVQLNTDVGNTAMRRAAEAAGFMFEGVLRGFWPPKGDHPPADYAMYAKTKHDHEDVT